VFVQRVTPHRPLIFGLRLIQAGLIRQQDTQFLEKKFGIDSKNPSRSMRRIGLQTMAAVDKLSAIHGRRGTNQTVDETPRIGGGCWRQTKGMGRRIF